MTQINELEIPVVGIIDHDIATHDPVAGFMRGVGRTTERAEGFDHGASVAGEVTGFLVKTITPEQHHQPLVFPTAELTSTWEVSSGSLLYKSSAGHAHVWFTGCLYGKDDGTGRPEEGIVDTDMSSLFLNIRNAYPTHNEKRPFTEKVLFKWLPHVIEGWSVGDQELASRQDVNFIASVFRRIRDGSKSA